MAIQTNFNFNGIEIPNAIIRIQRLWGSSREGWSSLVGVYVEKNIPATEEITEERLVSEATEDQEAIYETVVVQQAAEARTDHVLIEEFNHSAVYVEGVRGYYSLYKSIFEKFGGVEI